MVNEPTFGQWNGNRWVTLNKDLLVGYASFPLEWVFLSIGIIAYATNTVTSAKEGKVAVSSVPLLYFSANYLFILIFMRLHWDRYYIPTITASRILVADGIYATLTQAYRVIHTWKSGLLKAQ